MTENTIKVNIKHIRDMLGNAKIGQLIFARIINKLNPDKTLDFDDFIDDGYICQIQSIKLSDDDVYEVKLYIKPFENYNRTVDKNQWRCGGKLATYYDSICYDDGYLTYYFSEKDVPFEILTFDEAKKYLNKNKVILYNKITGDIITEIFLGDELDIRFE